MIWHLSTRVRERKKRLDHSEKKKKKKKKKKNNGTGLANKLKFNDRLDIFFLTKTASDLTESIVHFHRRLIYKYLTNM